MRNRSARYCAPVPWREEVRAAGLPAGVEDPVEAPGVGVGCDGGAGNVLCAGGGAKVGGLAEEPAVDPGDDGRRPGVLCDGGITWGGDADEPGEGRVAKPGAGAGANDGALFADAPVEADPGAARRTATPPSWSTHLRGSASRRPQ